MLQGVVLSVLVLEPSLGVPSESSCLLWYGDGCGSIKDRDTCLSSRDGRAQAQQDGKPVYGQPCVWCGGNFCDGDRDETCGTMGLVQPNYSTWVSPDPTNFSYASSTCEHGLSPPVSSFTVPAQKITNVVFVPKITPGQTGGQACRGPGGAADHGMRYPKPSYFWTWTATDLDQCKAFCRSKEVCTGVEFNADLKYCEVWWKTIAWTVGLSDGYECWEVTSAETVAQPNTSCLEFTPAGFGDGCGAITDEKTCLASKDGRTTVEYHGCRIHDEPCVWCGGGQCTEKADSKLCEAKDYLMKGQVMGLFKQFVARSNYTAAQCAAPAVDVNQTPAVPEWPDKFPTTNVARASNDVNVSEASTQTEVEGGQGGLPTWPLWIAVFGICCTIGYLIFARCKPGGKKKAAAKKAAAKKPAAKKRAGKLVDSSALDETGDKAEKASLVASDVRRSNAAPEGIDRQDTGGVPAMPMQFGPMPIGAERQFQPGMGFMPGAMPFAPMGQPIQSIQNLWNSRAWGSAGGGPPVYEALSQQDSFEPMHQGAQMRLQQEQMAQVSAPLLTYAGNMPMTDMGRGMAPLGRDMGPLGSMGRDVGSMGSFRQDMGPMGRDMGTIGSIGRDMVHMGRNCVECGTPVEPDSNFCVRCGAAYALAPAPTEPCGTYLAQQPPSGPMW